MIGNAVHVMKIATGEIEYTTCAKPGRVEGGKEGGKAWAENLSKTEWSEIAKKAAATR